MTFATVTIRFTSKGHIGSAIAAWLAGSGEFNHCMLIDDGMVYEAVTWPGALGFPVKRADEWQDPARWWCREVTAAALAAGRAVLDLQQLFPMSDIIHVEAAK